MDLGEEISAHLKVNNLILNSPIAGNFYNTNNFCLNLILHLQHACQDVLFFGISLSAYCHACQGNITFYYMANLGELPGGVFQFYSEAFQVKLPVNSET